MTGQTNTPGAARSLELQTQGARLHVRIDGEREPSVVFGHGLLYSGRMFDQTVASLGGRYRCIRPDFRGQGQSEVTASGYDIDSLAADLIEVIERLADPPCHYVGFSMGGFVGLRVALARPDLIASLVLMNTSAEAENPSKLPRYRLLSLVARAFGLQPVLGRLEPILFSPAFINDPEHSECRRQWLGPIVDNDRRGVVRAVKGVIRRASVLDRIHAIDCPTLIIAADQDRATPLACSEHMHHRINGSRLVVLEGTGHMTPAEAPDRIARLLGEFIEQQV